MNSIRSNAAMPQRAYPRFYIWDKQTKQQQQNQLCEVCCVCVCIFNAPVQYTPRMLYNKQNSSTAWDHRGCGLVASFFFSFFFCFLLRSLSALSHLLVAAQFPTSTICYVGFAFYLFIFLFSFRQWPHSPFHTLERTMYCSCLLHVCIYEMRPSSIYS